MARIEIHSTRTLGAIPWQCGEKECAAQWHLRHFWVYDDETFSECDSDGNHDEIDADDIPSVNAQHQAWRDYARHVAQTGEDPLGEYLVKRSIKKREVWKIRVRPSILGAVVYQVMRNRKLYDPRLDLPAHVTEYLTINVKNRNAAMTAFPTWAEFQSAFPKYTPGTWMRVEIDHNVSRNPKTVARELRKIASRAS